ncbi:Xanthine dehydrogenase, iron-sulfur cluster and FAD-binding subunit A [Rubrivivax sp. A210]|uniref:xanthine dehydrogenase small subunit n=1 Tax=Rubrivivax sp. A210 TaxID=2772301 RepID=UPI0019194FFA|nr:xanthine dehydrogenase small subunit [Rubrivivax sp. A210]CAD5372449.1 Xanthine dehydrogenase, iron-sulfur cluster and FAD-binding subunit A [Rubrivivax sp. A210]
MTERAIRFFHRGAVVEVTGAPATRTVLQWLREDARCSGSKEGCAEGDCGACTVVVGELDGRGGVALAPVNACIRFLPTLDGKALFTVEDVAAPDGSLHPVQQALVDAHGSQCGFCTPGFVMSLWACYERHQAGGTRPTRQQLADDLAGNLCRCTGYRPILDAGQAMFEASPRRVDLAPVAAALRQLAGHAPLGGAGDAATYHAPRTLDELAALRLARPAARLLAGGTDAALWVTKQMRELGEIIYLGDVAELRRIATDAGAIEIGAAATLEDAWAALAAEWPVLREVWLRFASPPVRHAGTMGGNVANGSPIGDAAPVLIALGARIVLRRGAVERSLALEDFYTGYMQNRLEAGEFVYALRVPRAGAALLRVYKISKRFDSDISAVCAALSLTVVEGRITAARLAWGGLAATVKRAAAAEAVLVGRPWDEAALLAAQAALAQDFQPLSDMRASAGYRLQVAQNLLRRCWLETRAEGALPATAISVWARTEAP